MLRALSRKGGILTGANVHMDESIGWTNLDLWLIGRVAARFFRPWSERRGASGEAASRPPEARRKTLIGGMPIGWDCHAYAGLRISKDDGRTRQIGRDVHLVRVGPGSIAPLTLVGGRSRTLVLRLALIIGFLIAASRDAGDRKGCGQDRDCNSISGLLHVPPTWYER